LIRSTLREHFEGFKTRAALILLAAGIGGWVLYVFRAPEPSWQGKPLSRWIRGLEYENRNPTDEQRAALRAMGEPAVTRLVELLQRRDSSIKKWFIAYCGNHVEIQNGFIAPRHVIPEDVYHAQAATALGAIGPAARSAIPALTIECTNTYHLVAARARAALMKIRQEPITPLLGPLADPGSTNWSQAALTAKYLGTNGEAAVPLLINSLQSTNVGVRQYSLLALKGIASRPDIAVPALMACLRDNDAGIRRAAIDALCEFKAAKPQIVPLLLASLQYSDNNVWLGAAFGLETLLNQDEKQTLFVPALLESLKSPDEAIRENAKRFLKRNDPETAARAEAQ
jgi:HEAT repeat protein